MYTAPSAEGGVFPLGFDATRRPGVRLAGDGVDVVVVAHHATAVWFCAIDNPGAGLIERRVPLFGPTNGAWHAHIPGIGAGQRYGLRVDGPWQPEAGLLHNPAKLLLDPYGRGVEGQPVLRPELFAHRVGDTLAPLDSPRQRDSRDSAPFMAYSTVVDDAFDWGGVPRPQVPWDLTVIYEAHVKGLTVAMPGVPEALRGTYAGLAHPATIAHLRDLGVTSVELLPIHASLSEPQLTDHGRTNYWGYSTMAFFAPHPRYATKAAREAGPRAVNDEVKGMIRLLHEAGIEVILDVVYNHTCEVGVDGPTVCWRGLDNVTWYLHDGSSPARYADVTGTGNTLDFRRADVVTMALDSLRYWAEEYHVDGFRYDLAVTLARGYTGYTRDHPFLVALNCDPVLRGLKHIAEPWDVGPGGWQTGSFPVPMAAWNDAFRGDVRRFWLLNPRAQSHGDPGVSARDLATRLSGSADLFGAADPLWSHGPMGSINFVTAHDGFTMADLVTFEHKRNEANGEDGRDGTNDNRSWNHGVEGPVREDSVTGELGTDIGVDAIAELRRRSIRNLLATMAFAAGVPMLTAGDELGRTQHGNNNAYCQDSPISWVDWNLTPWQRDLLATTAYLLRLRRSNPVLRPTSFFTGVPPSAEEPADLAWFDAAGDPITPDQWNDPDMRTVQMVRAAPAGHRDALVVVNGRLDPAQCTVPRLRAGCCFELVWDSSWENPGPRGGDDGASPLSRIVSGSAVPIDGLTVRLYLSLPSSSLLSPRTSSSAKAPTCPFVVGSPGS
ncbi:MAG: glycogen debranching protein GlgX [Bifidobacteriaceae bacterium]|jgi:glycogen operon protein|nr:glycogen debranching protein GlgX [Bifidobacteriaceae bacterium]